MNPVINMKRLLYSYLISMSLLLSATDTNAEEYVFVSLEFPPLEYTGEDGSPTGIAVDIVRKIMTSLGHEVQINIHPWSRSLDLVRKGNADAIFTAYRTPDREKFLDYSKEVLIHQTIALYAKKDSPIIFNGDLTTLRDKQIGVISTISYGPRFDQMRPNLNVQSVEKLEQNFQKLMLGRIDLFISNKFVADWKLQTTGMTNLITSLSREVDHVPSFIGFSRKQGLTRLRDDFDRELIRLKNNGEYKKILARYKM
ncbi:amino acid ABC transporter substrate-binding protein [Hahella sp. CCB-MM4]|uniref:substrate-binding periplasmic protein n=1 Tax=Hahella sp. (strain CCB-MM4) TaxID=1926491 RepID=UPI000B9B9570|nr:transporter substrate-binding domain-containing protein [Hahella sp. CCB-MM4]OZG71890.1 amino acid ABC transporter substrate-binding protein [Hahella sp. CCB-MM4]